MTHNVTAQEPPAARVTRCPSHAMRANSLGQLHMYTASCAARTREGPRAVIQACQASCGDIVPRAQLVLAIAILAARAVDSVGGGELLLCRRARATGESDSDAEVRQPGR